MQVFSFTTVTAFPSCLQNQKLSCHSNQNASWLNHNACCFKQFRKPCPARRYIDLKANFSLVLTLWHPAAFGDFRNKQHLNARGFVREYLCSYSDYRPGWSVKRRSKSSSRHSKHFFAWGCGFSVSDVISGGVLGHLGPLCLALGTNH